MKRSFFRQMLPDEVVFSGESRALEVSDHFKVNRGNQTSDRDSVSCPHQAQGDWRRDVGGTKERMVGGVAAVVSGRLFTGLSHGLCHNVMSVIHVCLCLETLWNVSWPSPIHKLGAAEGIKPGIFQTHSDHQFQKSTPPPPKKKKHTWETIYIYLRQISIMR